MFSGGGRPSAVDFAAVPDAHHQDQHARILDLRRHPVVADAPAPVSRALPGQRRAERSRVVERSDALFQGS